MAVVRLALCWRGMMLAFIAVCLLAGGAFFSLPALLDARLNAIEDIAQGRLLIERSGNLAALLTADGGQKGGNRLPLATAIGSLTALEEYLGTVSFTSDEVRALHRAAWQLPDGALRRYADQLQAIADGTVDARQTSLPSPVAALDVIDQMAVLQNQHTRNRLAVVTAGAAGALIMMAGLALLAMVAVLKPALTTVRHRLSSLKATLDDLSQKQLDAEHSDYRQRGREEERLKLAQAMEQCPDIVVIASTTGIIEYVNTAFLHNTGYARAEVIGQPTRILSSGATPRGTYRDLWATLIGGNVWTGELCNRRHDGSHYRVSATISPVRDEEGRIVRYLALEKDISQNRESSNTERHNQHHIQVAIENIDAPVALYDGDERLVGCNSRYRGLFGTRHAHLLKTGVQLAEILRCGSIDGLFGPIAGDRDGWVNRRLCLFRASNATPAGLFALPMPDRSAYWGGVVDTFHIPLHTPLMAIDAARTRIERMVRDDRLRKSLTETEDGEPSRGQPAPTGAELTLRDVDQANDALCRDYGVARLS